MGYLNSYTLLGYSHTGRTHQVRVHMAYLGHPLVGDPLYGPQNRQGLPAEFLEGQALHARRIGIIHPRTLQPLTFTAPLPAYFRSGLRRLAAGGPGCLKLPGSNG